jgi:hypothetical protein
MAKKKPGTAVVSRKDGAVMSMKDIEKQYADEAVEAVKTAPMMEGAPRIVASDQTFRMGEMILPDPLNLIVVAQSLLNTYYDSDYDPQQKTPPACFAVGPVTEDGDAVLHAHPTSPKPQGNGESRACIGCPQNQFGSAAIGKGKACANTRQLAVVMSDDPAFESAGELKWATMTISPTGLGPWGKFVTGLGTLAKRPPHGVITQFSFNKQDKDERRRKAVVAIGFKPISQPAMAAKVNQLRKQLLESKALERPLPVDGYADPVKQKKAPAKGKAKASGKKKR